MCAAAKACLLLLHGCHDTTTQHTQSPFFDTQRLFNPGIRLSLGAPHQGQLNQPSIQIREPLKAPAPHVSDLILRLIRDPSPCFEDF